MNRLGVVLFLALVFNLAVILTQGKGGNMTIQKGSRVSFDYTLTVDGEVVDTTGGKEPFQYTHGEAKIIPGLTRQLEGLQAGDEKRIEIPPEQAYGMIDSNAFQEVPRSQLPANIEPQVGMSLQARTQEGKTVVVRISELKGDTVVIDFNHPLAGKTLTFQVKIVSVE